MFKHQTPLVQENNDEPTRDINRRQGIFTHRPIDDIILKIFRWYLGTKEYFTGTNDKVLEDVHTSWMQDIIIYVKNTK